MPDCCPSWPYPKKIGPTPLMPPMEPPRDLGIYMDKPDNCYCVHHLHDSKMNQFDQIVARERKNCRDIFAVNKKMRDVCSDVLEHPCDNDDVKMVMIYGYDYHKRGETTGLYRPIKADTDAPPFAVVKTHKIGIKEGYRDPAYFRYSAGTRPTLGQDAPVTLIKIPTTVDAWFTNKPQRTTYQDYYSKVGLAAMKNMTQFKEPLPSSRKRYADPCL